MDLRKMFHVGVVLGCGWIGFGCDASERPQSEPVDGGSDTQGPGDVELDPMFVALLKFTRATPVPETLSEVFAESTAVFRGTFTNAEEGRVIDFKTGASNPHLTVVFTLKPTTVLKGPKAEFFYSEYPRAIVAPAEDFQAHLPAADCLFILREPGWDTTVYRFDFEGRGVPVGATLHTFNFPFGIVCEGAGGKLEYPLLVEVPPESFVATTLDDLEAEMAATLMNAE